MGQHIVNFKIPNDISFFSRENRYLKNFQWNILPVTAVSPLTGCIELNSSQGIWLGQSIVGHKWDYMNIMFHGSIKILFLANQFALGSSQTYFWARTESHFAYFSSSCEKDSKRENFYLEDTMTFTLKITHNRI